MKPGDLVRLGESVGLIVCSHPKGELVKVHWSDTIPSWEKSRRLFLVSKISCDKFDPSGVQLEHVD